MNIPTEQTHRLREQTYGCRWRWKGWGEGRVREFGMDMYTQLYLGPSVQQRELCSVLPGSLDGSLEENGYTHMYGWGWILHSSPETITALLISYTPIQKKRLKKYPGAPRCGTPSNPDLIQRLFRKKLGNTLLSRPHCILKIYIFIHQVNNISRQIDCLPTLMVPI